MEKTPGNYGEESWAAVFGDFIFSPDVEDAAALMRIAQIAAVSETPFIGQASPKIFGVESLAETPDADDWKTSQNSSEGKLWAMLREMPESAYLGLTIPRILARMPYGAKNDPTENFAFEELDSPPYHNHYLWANGIFASALVLAQSFREAGSWEMERLVQDIDDVPMHLYKENGETKIKPGAEIVMTQKAAEKIIGQGLMPLISFRDSDRIRLARLQSVSASSESLRGKWS
jgi:type VI secretion system protein ImpC